MTCPRCGGLLEQRTDGYGKYLNCMMCSRQFDLTLGPRAMTPQMLFDRHGIKLPNSELRAFERMEKRRKW